MRRFERAKHCIVAGTCAALLAPAGTAIAQDLTSRAESRRDVALTVYNGDLCLVREVRRIDTRDGTFRLRYEDVTAGIDPTSVSMRATNGRALRIVEQNYEYDLLSRAKLMQKYVGRQVGYRTEEGRRGTATLLSAHEGFVYELDDKIVFELPGDIELQRLPSELSARPTLVWTLAGERNGEQEVDVSYLSSGIDWRADYVLALNEREDTGQLTGWVTLNNTSGAAFENAQLQLVAGDVRRVREILQRRPRRELQFAAEAMPQFQEEAFFEYHLYTLERRTDLKDNQTKQILFFDADGVAVSKSYRFHGSQARLAPRYDAQPGSQAVDVLLHFQNSKANHLGLPIPQGIVRVYKADARGAKQFLGENRVRHTPKDERLEFEVGKAFDVVGEHVQTDYRRTGERAYEVEFQVKLRNHKSETIEVSVREEFLGDWKILSSSLEFEKIDATTAEFVVSVPAAGETVLVYRAHVQT